MSNVIEGRFRIHRTQSANGSNAILVIPETPNDVLTLDKKEITFEHVDGGQYDPDSYLTITDTENNKIHFGPDTVVKRLTN